ncbi:winged helix-turn-helix transcriptional regulator [Spelaeicoccus albus]|uniref:DNA-binding HxlR family transcriptional regulator n=1 Tax=Spelaeicoccus albus TaxID=1280376 RepID=A0A7Z0D2D3_9MICO|nr:helix-turn-helix domain-containing protein [Spelaeicoccus albus]NYI67603.1 DNA-binding HxlR family transcriptional regulator [Spelaeicoccus albus]
MDWLQYDTTACSIGRTLDVIGEKWTMLVLRELFNGVRRFDQIRDHVGVSDPVLSDRLRTLAAAEIVDAVPYREPGRRTRNEYRLTTKGFDLYPALIALLQWGDRYCAEPSGPPLRVTHRECDEPLEAVIECTAGHRIHSPREATARPGPGARSVR